MSAKILGIDVGSVKICAAMAELDNTGDTKIIAISSCESKGLKKGSITNIELAANSIQTAVNDVIRIAGTNYDRVIVSLSGKDTQNIEYKNAINIPDKEVNLTQISRLLEDVEYRVQVPPEYEIVHTLPYNFKLDEQENIEDPLGMNGTRLEAEVHIIVAQRSSIINLRKAIEKAGLKADNIVLSAYASSIATLNDDERTLGAALIDMGGATCNMIVHSGNSVRYNDFLGVGSASITNDISAVIHTPIAKAEEVKLKLGDIKREGLEKIALPDIGDERELRQTDVNIIAEVIFARVNETLLLLAEMLNSSKYAHLAGAGVVLTGGMTKLEGLRELATLVFNNMSVRIARPSDIEGLDEAYKDPAYSCAIGLCLYGAGRFTPYEKDSERKMRYKGEPPIVSKAASLSSVQDLDRVDNKPDIPNINIQNSWQEQKIAMATEDLGIKIDNEPKQTKELKQRASVHPLLKAINYFKNLF